MKSALFTVLGAVALTAAATPSLAQEVEIEDAVARVIVIVEDRADIGVEITQGDAGLPPLQLRRRGDKVMIDGDLSGRDIRECSGDAAGASQPGQGAFVEVRRIGRVDMSRAPLIVLRTPRAVQVGVEGAVYGAVGRGASSIQLANAGCGSWTVANTDGGLSVSLAGSGDVRAGTSSSLEVSVAGSGDLTAGATRSLEASIAGSGNADVARVDGPVEISIAGSGDVLVRAGQAPRLEASIAGSGNVDFRGEAGDVEASLVGSGDVHVGSVTGSIDRSIIGSGDVTVGR